MGWICTKWAFRYSSIKEAVDAASVGDKSLSYSPTGSASCTDRIAMHNQLLSIEEELGGSAEFPGIESLNFGG